MIGATCCAASTRSASTTSSPSTTSATDRSTQPLGRRDQRLLRPPRVLPALRARRARPVRRGLPRRRVLRHHGARRPAHARPQLPRFEDAARCLPGAGHAAALRVFGGGLRRRVDLSRGAGVRAAAQRVRLLEAAVRQRRPARPAERGRPGRGLSLLQRLRPARAAQGPDGVGRVSSLRAVPRQRRVKLFGPYGGYGPGEQARDFVYVDDVVAVNLWFLANPQRAASSISAPAGPSRSTTSPRRSSTRRVPSAANRRSLAGRWSTRG